MTNLRYPLERLERDSDYLKVRVLENPNKTPVGTILLPIPESLSDMNGVTWESDSLDSVSKFLYDSAKNVVDRATEAAKDGGTLGAAQAAVDSISNSLLTAGNAAVNNQDVNNALVTKFTADAANNIGANVDAASLLSRETGQVLNPNMELLFKGVQLRGFTFNFKMTPRSAAEGQQVKGIINTFKKRMAAKQSVSGSNSGVFIAAPDIFELEFMSGGRPHPFLFKLKKCALVNMNVSYSDQGPYITYEDATPVAMTMSLQFRELSPVFQEDYDGTDGVGF